MSKAVRPPQNKILAALPSKEYNRLLSHLTPVSLHRGDTLYETKDRIKYVYFVNRAVVSLVTHMEEGPSVEVGLVGNEGMVGLSIVMMSHRITPSCRSRTGPCEWRLGNSGKS